MPCSRPVLIADSGKQTVAGSSPVGTNFPPHRVMSRRCERMKMEEMAMTSTNGSKPFLGIPTPKGLRTAFLVIIIFMALAFGLYLYEAKPLKDYVIKVADTLIQGAIISIFFALLKAMIDKSPLWRVIQPWGGDYGKK